VQIDALNPRIDGKKGSDRCVEDYTIMDGEHVQEDPYQAFVNNESMIPPDNLTCDGEY
jgi:hypothetical protein